MALFAEYETLFDRLTKEAKKLLSASPFGNEEQLNLVAETAIAGFAIFSGLLSSGLQLLSLFRTDQEIKSYKIDIEDQVLAITVAGHLKQHNDFEVYHSAIVPVDPLGKSQVMSRLHNLNKARDRLSQLQNQLGVKEKPATATTPEQTTLPAPHAADDRKAKLNAQIADALKDFDILQQSLCKVDEKLGTSTLSRVLTGESLEARLREKGGYILWVKAVVAGGMSHIRVSSNDSSLTYGAGAVVSYAIFNANGTLAEANTIPLYGGKLKVDDLPEAKLKTRLHLDEEDGAKEKPRPKGSHRWWSRILAEGGQ